MKRLLASLLCATLILSPVGNASTVYATEAAEVVQQVQETAEGQQDTDADAAASEEDAVGASDEQEGKETAAEADETGADSSEADGADGEQKDESTTGDEAASEVEPSDDETPADQETSEDAGAEDDELPADDAAESEIVEENAAETEEVEIEEADDLLGRDSSACFEVDADGTLVLKEGTKLPKKAVIPAGAKKIPSGIFDNENVNGENTEIQFEEDSALVEIADGAFRNSKITGITIPKGVTKIGPYTFSGTSSLTKADFAGKVTYIGNNAFSNSAVTNITAPNVTEVGDYAFSSCSSLERVSMEALNTVGNSAFSGCTSLDDMPFQSALTSIGTSAFAGCALTEIDLSMCTGITLGENCFQNNDKLETVSLPNSLEVIPQKAFYGDVKLKDVYFGTKDSGNMIREIHSSAFENCAALKNLVFYNVYVFKSKAFEGCGGITSITIWNTDTDSDAFSIAEDAFPNKSKVVMSGYDGKVEEYADKRGYTFETLYPKHSISVECAEKNAATITLSKTKATKGTKIRVTVAPNLEEEYHLSDISIPKTVVIPSDEIILVENTDEHQVFEFTMPDGDVTVKVDMVKGAVIKKPLSYKFEAINGYTPDPVGAISTFDVPGRESRLTIRDKNGKTKNWYWTFSSSNSKVVSITNSGVVRSTGVGVAKLTATLKTDSSMKVEVDVKVLNPADIVRVELDMPTSVPRGRIVTPVVVDGEEIPVIEFEKAALASGAKNFDVSIRAYAEDIVPSLITTSKWTSTDSKVATVASGSSSTNTNTVKVAKNAVGETLITVSVLNKGEKTASEDNKKSFIVRVVDATPRLQNSTLTVDSRSEDGTKLSIVTVYGYSIKNDQLILTTKKTDSNGIVTYPRNVGELDVYYENDAYYICNSNPKEPFEKNYDGKLFLEGTLEGSEGQEETFHIPIKKLTVTNKALNPTLKTTGKINLFYNSSADSDLTGMVTVTQSLKDLEVKKVELVSAANNKKAGSEAVDSFAANFNIVKKNNTTFEITRSDSEMIQVGGKNVTKGYLKITYKGYVAPVVKSLTVPTCDTAPDYVLDKTSATASLYSSDQEYELHLVDKKTKKIVQDLSTLDTDEDHGNIVGLGFTTKTTAGVFKDIEDTDVAEAKATDTITLKVDGTPSKAKAYIYVRMTTWSRELTYTFTLNTSNALPAVKFSATTVTLNNTYSKQAAKLTLSENQPEAVMAGIGSIVYTGKKNIDAAFALLESMEVDTVGEDLSVKFSLRGKQLPKGTYAFKVTPKVTYDGDERVATKAQTLKIVVAQTSPTIKFNSSTFKFNASILDRNNPSNEEVTRTFKLGNLPTGVTGEVDDSEVEFNAVGTSPDFKTVVDDIDFAAAEATATILNNTTTISNAGKTLKYKVHNLKVATDSGDSAVIPDFNIAIQLDKKAVAVKVKGTGSINPLDTSSRVTYTATLSNISSEIDDIKIWEKDGNKWYGGNKEKDRYSEHFTIVKDDEKDTVAYLSMKPDKQLENGKKYNLTLVYTLKAVPGKPDAHENPDAPEKRKTYQTSVTVTPKQVLPQVTTDVKEATIYAGQTDKSFKVTVTQKKSKDMMEYIMTGVTFADGTSNAIKRAFKITDFDSATGVVTVTLVNPSAVVQNSTYTLNFVTSYKNQAAKSTGNKFSVKVTVKK